MDFLGPYTNYLILVRGSGNSLFFRIQKIFNLIKRLILKS